MILYALVSVVFIGVLIAMVLPNKGCGGDCNQGRRECNCKGKK